MEYTYTIIKTETGEVLEREDADGKKWWIPMDESNADYQAYLNPDKVEHSTEIPTVNEAATK